MTAFPGRGSALRFVISLGIVSLFADMTYEGGRSIAGPYLEHLGASAAVVGFVAGAGELLGYGLRLGSGRAADRTGRYWPVMFIGYTINLLAVPALALSGRWQVAALLMILERAGRAIRIPARDAMLAHATHAMGHGWGFGLHEALDQSGALIGPLLVALMLAHTGSYGAAFGILLVPALLSLTALTAARHAYPHASDLHAAVTAPHAGARSPAFRLYVAAGALVAAGYADFALIAYHFARASIVPALVIPLLYALAMGSAAASALIVGRWLDRFGLVIVSLSVLAAAAFAPLSFIGHAAAAVIGVVVWGLGMGIQDSVMRAGLASIVPAGARAGSFGLFDAVYGVAWFAGSTIMGALYDQSASFVVAFSVCLQIGAAALFLGASRSVRSTMAT